MHERVLFWRGLSVPHFRPPTACKSSLNERTLSREPSRSRLERSPRQQATPEGVVGPKGGYPTPHRFFRHRVRAVQSPWQNEY